MLNERLTLQLKSVKERYYNGTQLTARGIADRVYPTFHNEGEKIARREDL